MSEDTWNTRLTLLQRAKNPDDHQAWEEFTSYYFNFVKMVLAEMNVNYNDRDDLTQEVLLALWKTLPKFELDKKRGRFRTWMGTVVHNKVVDHYRKVSRRNNKIDKYRAEGEVSFPISKPEIENIIQSEWEVYVVQTALDRVSPHFSGKAMDVFKLSMENLSPVEIAERLDLQKTSVNKLKNRVKERVLQEIEKLKEEMFLFDE